jgi:hypothetical protein
MRKPYKLRVKIKVPVTSKSGLTGRVAHYEDWRWRVRSFATIEEAVRFARSLDCIGHSWPDWFPRPTPEEQQAALDRYTERKIERRSGRGSWK